MQRTARGAAALSTRRLISASASRRASRSRSSPSARPRPSGAGASSPAATYPSRLEAELKQQLPGLPITVLNKGIGGEEAPQMVARFDADVIDEKPDLVLWQVGSNSVLRDHPTPGEVIRQGVERLKASGTEVVLINPQYAPKILAKPDVGHAVDVITATARDEEVGLFDRFAVMRYWRESERIPFEHSSRPTACT